MALENVTVLFTDLVGSTELSWQLAPGQADELRRAHFACLRREIANHSGTEVKNLGDGLMVVFGTASAALMCAVAMQQAVDVDNRARSRALELRVGLSAGEASREGDDYFGEPVVEAARLCAWAGGGQIVASDLVRSLAGRHAPCRLASLGALELKGLPDPVDAVEVAWEPLSIPAEEPAEVPLPSRLARNPAIGLIGRSADSAALADAYKRVVVGEGPEVVLVSGEAGTGKTTLAADAARMAHAAGACVLLGRCEEDLGAPYGPFVEALAHYVAHGPSDLLGAYARSHGAPLCRIVPTLADRTTVPEPAVPSDPEAERYLLFAAVAALVAKAAAIQPVVLVLDDLQWADKPSLQLLRYILSRSEPMRLLVIGTYRDAELTAYHPLTETLAALQRESGMSRLALRGLDDAGVLAFMEAAAGHDLDDDGVALARAVYRETDGNPFFVGEVLRHLTETGAVAQDSTGRWRPTADLAAIPLPDSVRHVVGARVASLGSAGVHALSLAAVIGRDFDLELLARVSGRPEEELLALLDAASTRALVRELSGAPGRYSFSHALIQHTLYQDLGSTRRARAHRAVAESLEQICGDDPAPRLGELAHHWFNSVRNVDTRKAVAYSWAAADAAMAALAPEDAVRYFGQALELVSQLSGVDPLLEIDLRIGLGNAQRQAGVADYRETLLAVARRAREAGADDRLVAAALANNRGSFSAVGVVDEERVAVLRSALDVMAKTDSPERSLLLATLAVELSWGPLESRLALIGEAMAMARRLGDPTVLVRVANLARQPRDVPFLLQERITDAEQAYLLADESGDPTAVFWAAVHRRMVAVQSADFPVARTCLDKLRSVADRLRQPLLLYWARMNETGDALNLGDPNEAESMAAEAFRIGGESGQPDALAFYGAQMLLVRLQQGRLGELVPLLAQVVADNPGVPAYSGALALAHLEAGQEAEARRLLLVAEAGDFSVLPMDIAWTIGTTLYADVAAELRHAPSAAKLLEQLAPYHDQVPFNPLIRFEPVAFSLGQLAAVLGRYDEADRYFRAAMEISDRGGMAFSRARVQLAWGRMLRCRRDRGDHDRARELLEEAAATAAVRDYARVGRETATELAMLSP